MGLLYRLLNTFFVCSEIAFVVSVAIYFFVEGFQGNSTLNLVLLFFGASSLFMLVAHILASRRKS
jgi:hypothetical protein